MTGPITRWLASAISGRGARGDLAHGGDVGVDVGGDLGVGAVGERARLDALVAVGDVDGQQRADVGTVDGAASAPAPSGSPAQRAARAARPRPSPRRVDERVSLGMAVLAEQMHLVPEPTSAAARRAL